MYRMRQWMLPSLQNGEKTNTVYELIQPSPSSKLFLYFLSLETPYLS